MFTESGAFKALSLDLCERIGLELPSLSPAAERVLKEALPAFIPPSNPLDLTAQGLVDPSLYRRTLPAFLDDEQFGSVFMGIIFTDPATTALKLPPILDAFRTIKPTKPAIFAAMDEGAPFNAEGIQELRQLGVPMLSIAGTRTACACPRHRTRESGVSQRACARPVEADARNRTRNDGRVQSQGTPEEFWHSLS